MATSAEQQRAWRKANPDKVREYNRRYRERHVGTDRASRRAWAVANPAIMLLSRARHEAKRGGYAPPALTVKELSRMLDSRGGMCPICRENPAGHLDHDHITGRVRGWLCSNCNLMLGHAKDNSATLARAQEYLNAKH
jgi:hypothetical protein